MADLPRLVGRYYRASNAARATEGSGLGLAGARQIVEEQGERLTVASEEGEGRTFTVRLPLGGEGRE